MAEAVGAGGRGDAGGYMGAGETWGHTTLCPMDRYVRGKKDGDRGDMGTLSLKEKTVTP